MHGTLPGNRIFADIIKDLEIQSSWIEGGPKSNAWRFYKAKGEGGLRHTDTEKQGRRAHEESGEDGSRDGSDAATSQGTPRPPEVGRGKEGASERTREHVSVGLNCSPRKLIYPFCRNFYLP